MDEKGKTTQELLEEIDFLKARVIDLERAAEEQRQTGAALREREERFRTILENSLDVIMVFDENFRHLYVNPPAEAQAGLAVSDFIGKTHADLGFPKEFVALCEDSLGRVFVSGKPNRIEFMLPRGIWIDWLIIPIVNQEGKTDSVITFARDITDRKQNEERLQLAEASIESCGIPMLWFDRESNVVRVNDALCRHLGYSREEALTLRLGDLDPDFSDDGKWDVAREEIRTREQTTVRERRHRKSDGTIVPVEVMSTFFTCAAKEYVFTFVRDISERKRVEKELEASQRTLKAIFDNIFQFTGLMNSEGILTETNKTSLDYIGADIEEVRDRPFWEAPWWRHSPAVREELKSAILRAASGEFVRYETTLCSADGTIIDMDLSIKPVKDNDGRVVLLIPEARDVTDRKQAEEALRASETRYRMLFNDNPLPALVFDRKTLKIVDVNKAATAQYGYSHQEFLSMTVKELRPTEDIPKLLDAVAISAADLNKVPFFKHKRKDGTLFDVMVSAHDLDYGQRPYRLVLLIDITERNRTEEELKLTQFSVEQSAIPTFWLTTAGEVFRANRAACASLGYTEEELIGTNIQGWGTLSSSKPWDSVVETLKEKRSIAIESCHIRKDGSRFPVDTTLNYLEFGGKEYIFAFATDTSDRKKAEEEKEKLQSQLFQTQKMETVGHLAGGVAHDFNNILTAIMGYGQLLQMTLVEESQEKGYIKEILTAAGKAVDLTKSLLAFSRKQDIDLQPCSMKDIVEGAERLLKRLITEDINMIVSLPLEDGIVVMADATQIDQVLMNLSTNACDAMPGGGSLAITLEDVELDVEFTRLHNLGMPGRYALFSVSDTGTGMDRGTTAKIFDPFFTTKEAGKGTGLGLSIVYGIVKQHKGHISVYSEPGKGTTFRVYLPAVDMGPKKEDQGFVQFTGGTETVLLVEDNSDVLCLTKTILETAGYTVVSASDGEEAVEEFRSNHDGFDLLILDVVMPGKNGREVYEEVSAIRSNVKVLFTSGYTRDILVSRGIEDGRFNFLPKPSPPMTLLAKIRNVLDE